MATNRDLLKEAIADAKAVKEMAIANAKSALEEAFTPRIKEMFSAKLHEMDSEEEEEMEKETMEEAGFESMDSEDKSFSGLKGNIPEAEEEDMMEEELNLEELLAELEEEEVEESLNEAEEEEETEEVESEEEVEEEGEPLDLEDMTDEDLKKMIEDVIADMIEAGELEAGEGEEGEEEESEEGEEMEMSDEEEVNLDELLREIEEETNEEIVNESVADIIGQLQAIDPAIMGDVLKATLVGLPLTAFGAMFATSWKKAKEEEKEKLRKAAEKAGATKELEKAIGGETTNESPELEEAYSTIESLRSDLNEVNLLNAKLLYSNKIFKAKNLNESQKVKVLSSFDKANTVGEVKLVFETLNEGLKVKNTIKENRGSASKSTIVPTTKKPIVESNDAFARMQQLAFYKSEQ
jgi:hypothetical protein